MTNILLALVGCVFLIAFAVLGLVFLLALGMSLIVSELMKGRE